MTVRLVDRSPVVSPGALIEALVPPPLFRDVRFDTYLPDPGERTQAEALAAARSFAATLASPSAGHGGRFGRRPRAVGGTGIYLDGGFGVGKTHLLASLWHAAPEPKAYATFVELTHLTGALGFAATVEQLASMRLLAIDEFELDDPGDTVLVSSLLSRLAESGVALAATSNTLPDRLGEGRFAAEDFLREIQQLAARFSTVRVDGPDYRHRGLPDAPEPWSSELVRQHAAGMPDASMDDFAALTRPPRHAAPLPLRGAARGPELSPSARRRTSTRPGRGTAARGAGRPPL